MLTISLSSASSQLDLLQRSATGLRNSLTSIRAKKEGNVYYDFQDLLDTKENPSEPLSGSHSAKLIDKPANSKSYLPGGIQVS